MSLFSTSNMTVKKESECKDEGFVFVINLGWERRAQIESIRRFGVILMQNANCI